MALTGNRTPSEMIRHGIPTTLPGANSSELLGMPGAVENLRASKQFANIVLEETNSSVGNALRLLSSTMNCLKTAFSRLGQGKIFISEFLQGRNWLDVER